MRKALATVNVLAFSIAGVAITIPDPARFVRHWSDATIYPWWAALYVVVGVGASIVSVLYPQRSWAPVVPTVLIVLAAQIAGLGLVAVKHWEPSFGMGGGYAGSPENLVRLAWVIAIAGTVAGASAIAQLVLLKVFPVRSPGRTMLLLGGIGALVLLLLPLGIAAGDPGLRDVTSLGAFVLLYSGPIGVTVIATAWLSERLRTAALASSTVAAALSALGEMPDLSHLHGRPALAATAAILAGTGMVKSLKSDAAAVRV
jgi:hypothetical protein